MRPFAYDKAPDEGLTLRLGADAAQGQTDAKVQYLAGGTTLIDLMRLDVLRPERVVDISSLQALYGQVTPSADGLRIGALARMSKVADDPVVLADYPALAQSLHLAASAQLRNMATMGGNVLQRTRCPYFRDPSWSACNKRTPGSGCAAITGFNRNHAVLGVDDHCISQYPGDLAVVLTAFEAVVELSGPAGPRSLPFSELHRASGQPHLENTLRPGELITSFLVPKKPWTQRSLYLKIRDRQSYEFAIASAAVGLELDGERVRNVRIGLGGVAYRPWRSKAAEASLIGQVLDEQTAEYAAVMALEGAQTHGDNNYKPELSRRTLVRALMETKAMETARG